MVNVHTALAYLPSNQFMLCCLKFRLNVTDSTACLVSVQVVLLRFLLFCKCWLDKMTTSPIPAAAIAPRIEKRAAAAPRFQIFSKTDQKRPSWLPWGPRRPAFL